MLAFDFPNLPHPNIKIHTEKKSEGFKAGFRLNEYNDSAAAARVGACVSASKVDSLSAAIGRIGQMRSSNGSARVGLIGRIGAFV